MNEPRYPLPCFTWRASFVILIECFRRRSVGFTLCCLKNKKNKMVCMSLSLFSLIQYRSRRRSQGFLFCLFFNLPPKQMLELHLAPLFIRDSSLFLVELWVLKGRAARREERKTRTAVHTQDANRPLCQVHT